MGEHHAKDIDGEMSSVGAALPRDFELATDDPRPRWEYINILCGGNDLVQALNKAGEKGWEAWAVLGNAPGGVVIGFRRRKRLIDIVGTVPSKLIGA